MFTLTHKQLDMHGCVLSTAATDALVLKHQAISIQSVDQIFIVLDNFSFIGNNIENEFTFWKRK